MIEYWNHNTAYHPVILDAVPAGCGEALDIGSGDGLLAHRLTGRAKHVTGLDVSPEMVALARAREIPGADFRHGGILTEELPAEGYDFICSVATVHHLDFTAALTRMRELLRPGGTLVVVGLARNATLRDWAYEPVTVPWALLNRWVREKAGPPGMPVKDATMSYGEVRAEAGRILPGVRYRRRLLWRYSLVWHKAPA